MKNTYTLPQLGLSYNEEDDGENFGLHPFIRIPQSPTTYTGATILWGKGTEEAKWNACLQDFGPDEEEHNVYGVDEADLEKNILSAFKELHDSGVVNNYDKM